MIRPAREAPLGQPDVGTPFHPQGSYAVTILAPATTEGWGGQFEGAPGPSSPLANFSGDKPAPSSSCLPLTLLSASLCQASSSCQVHVHLEALSLGRWGGICFSRPCRCPAEPLQVFRDSIAHRTLALDHGPAPVYLELPDHFGVPSSPEMNFTRYKLIMLSQLSRCVPTWCWYKLLKAGLVSLLPSTSSENHRTSGSKVDRNYHPRGWGEGGIRGPNGNGNTYNED